MTGLVTGGNIDQRTTQFFGELFNIQFEKQTAPGARPVLLQHDQVNHVAFAIVQNEFVRISGSALAMQQMALAQLRNQPGLYFAELRGSLLASVGCPAGSQYM